MLNKLCAFLARYQMLQPGDTVVCALSGGADSVALTYGLWLLQEKLGITVEAAHFNHHLRGEESDRDEAFVRSFCRFHQIPLHIGGAVVLPGEKGLEAAAREARYSYFATLPGKLATAHTADDNAETVLLHLVRGTGLKGLGGIAPVRGRIIRPMLDITRQEVLDFIREYSLEYVEDSSNQTDDFLRNRLRHRVLPLLKQENPSLATNWSAMAQYLRQDEAVLQQLSAGEWTVSRLRQAEPSVRRRALTDMLQRWGVREPETRHIQLAQQLVFSDNPSALAQFPGGVTVGRCYDRLEKLDAPVSWKELQITDFGTYTLEDIGWEVQVKPAREGLEARFPVTIRPRRAGDSLRLPGGTKTVKKLLIDRKIPQSQRALLPVAADEKGVLAVADLAVNRDRLVLGETAVEIIMCRINSCTA